MKEISLEESLEIVKNANEYNKFITENNSHLILKEQRLEVINLILKLKINLKLSKDLVVKQELNNLKNNVTAYKKHGLDNGSITIDNEIGSKVNS